MIKKKHIQRHKDLHSSFDELLADFKLHNPKKYLNETTIDELIEWSFNQMKNPTKNDNGG